MFAILNALIEAFLEQKTVLHNIPRPEDREFLSSPPQILSVSRAIAASKDLDGDPKDKSEVSRLQRASADREVTSHSPWTCSFRQDRLDDSANRCVSRGRFKSSFIASDLVVFEMLGLGVDWARIERAARVEGERRPFEHGDCNGRWLTGDPASKSVSDRQRFFTSGEATKDLSARF